MFADFISGYQSVLHCIAELVIYTLELIGILIVMIGSIRAIVLIFTSIKNKQQSNIVINLGKSLALALEFKMGAEIVNTVIVRDLSELGVLAIVIAIRALLAVLIHWEIKAEKKEEADQPPKKD